LAQVRLILINQRVGRRVRDLLHQCDL